MIDHFKTQGPLHSFKTAEIQHFLNDDLHAVLSCLYGIPTFLLTFRRAEFLWKLLRIAALKYFVSY